MRLGDSVTTVQTFEDLNLKPQLLRGILAHGLERPALCQRQVILPCIAGRDVICQAQSGMGKTAAFCIAVLQRIDPTNKKCQALVLTPTRELAEQVRLGKSPLISGLGLEC
jgi:translation initiation factor 4A